MWLIKFMFRELEKLHLTVVKIGVELEKEIQLTDILFGLLLIEPWVEMIEVFVIN